MLISWIINLSNIRSPSIIDETEALRNPVRSIEGSVAGGWIRGGVGAYEPDPTRRLIIIG